MFEFGTSVIVTAVASQWNGSTGTVVYGYQDGKGDTFYEVALPGNIGLVLYHHTEVEAV